MADHYKVEFFFELEPHEAENFSHLFTQYEAKILSRIMEETAEGNEDSEDRIEWYEKHLEYMKKIEEKVIWSSRAIHKETGEVLIEAKNGRK